ncbi:hypothetical protein ACFLVO_03205 [Chloroflexota bacterium]
MEKLHRQWMERAGLPPDDIPRERFAEDMMPPEDNRKSHLNILSILLGVSLVILCAGLVLLMLYSC